MLGTMLVNWTSVWCAVVAMLYYVRGAAATHLLHLS